MSRCPLDYRLCTQTVTVYRKDGNGVRRQVIENCFFTLQTKRHEDVLGVCHDKAFLLIIPEENQSVFPGNWIFPGIGPEISDWSQVISAENMAEAAYAQQCFWEGIPCHTEAGSR